MAKIEYDVVIVGSGIAGSVMAKTLTQAGKRVLLLEAGLQAGIDLDPVRSYRNYQSYIQTFYSNTINATNTPYPDVTDAPSSDVLQIKAQTPYDSGYFVQLGPLPFASDNLRAPGGTTLHWLGTTPRMLPHDFRMKSLYGVGVDWPISYEDLMPYYEMAENEIGVSGDVQDQNGPDMSPANYGKDYVFPMHRIPQSYLDQRWMRNTQGLRVFMNGRPYTVTCVSTPQGRNSDPNLQYKYAGVKWDPVKQRLYLPKSTETYRPVGAIWDPTTGERCEGNAACVPICPVQAKYNGLKSLKRADHRHLVIQAQSVASRLVIDPKTQAITGVEYKRYTDPVSKQYALEVAQGKVYVLACSAIENAKLLLASNAANASDQVGRNLMDHMVLLTWGLMPERVYPYRGPGSTTNIPTFRDGEFRKDHSAWISPIDNWGWSWPVFSPGSDVTTAVFTNGMWGKQLRGYLGDRISRQLLLHFECEQDPQATNRVTIDPRYVDNIGNYRPVIRYDVSDYVRKAFKAATEVSKQIFAANGIEDFTQYNPNDADYVTYDGVGYTWWGAGHIVGTHRMGFTPEDSVVDKNCRTWDHKNLYLVGCGNMPTLGTSNPTLTMTALTFKAAESVLRQLETPKP